MAQVHQFVRVDFHRFKAFSAFALHLRPFNILVGPNNAGKSTILTAFRILAAAMRKAGTRKPEMLRGPDGRAPGYTIDLRSISVAEENIFFNYDDSEPASVRFTLSNKHRPILLFPARGACYLFGDAQDSQVCIPTAFIA